MRKTTAVIAGFLMSAMLLFAASAEDTAWLQVPDSAAQGEQVLLTYACADASDVQLAVVDADGNTILTMLGIGGNGSLLWDTSQLAEGYYTLRLTSGGKMSEAAIAVTRAKPEILDVDAPAEVTADWKCTVTVNRDGILSAHLEDGTVVLTQVVTAGSVQCTLDASLLSTGSHEVSFRLTDADGTASDIWAVDVEKTAPMPAADVTFFSPDDVSGMRCEHENCYWKLDMGRMDEDTIWAALTSPVTVLSGSERNQYKVRRDPDKNCKTYTGCVIYESQAVHVLQQGDEWTLIEAYSSCTEGSSVKVYATLFTGYVETKLLKEKEVSQTYGVVVDKLQQRLYVFKEGKLYSTLLCSTGYVTKDAPWNETPAGEFLAISWTGGFWSGSLYCDLAIRINDGILLHEVPCLIETLEDGTTKHNYDRCERYLGEKASHGCIRIQRALSPEGVNAKWLWDNLPRKGAPCKVIIWDDAGRTLGYPDDDYVLYYNETGGKYYHSSATCAAVREKYWPLTPFTYGQLSEKPYSKLTRCAACAPQLSHSEIDTLNQKNNR